MRSCGHQVHSARSSNMHHEFLRDRGGIGVFLVWRDYQHGSPDTYSLVSPIPSNSSGCSVPASSTTLNSTSLHTHCQSLS